MTKTRHILLCATFASGAALACASLPVVVGAHGNAQLDSCPSIGEISKDSYIADSPNIKPALLLPIAKGTRVFLCGSSSDGRWESVVIATDGQDFGVSEPVSAPARYAGPYKSGWAPNSAFVVIAG